MQGDLISRSALLESFRKSYCGHLGMENSDGMLTFRSICRIINEQPTAYDVEKVIEQTHEIFRNELHLMLKPFPDGTEYPEEAYRLLYLNDCVGGTIRNGGKE